MRRLTFAVGAMILLALALSCSHGRLTPLPVPPGSGAEGSHEEQNLDVPPIPPPWEQDIPFGYPTWTDPETGWTYVFYNPTELRYTEVIFKPDEWWIEEDYPIDDDTRPWKIHEEAAVKELGSRGYNLRPQYDAMTIVPRWYKVILPEGMNFFDVEYSWPEEFPCIDRVTPDIYVWLD